MPGYSEEMVQSWISAAQDYLSLLLGGHSYRSARRLVEEETSIPRERWLAMLPAFETPERDAWLDGLEVATQRVCSVLGLQKGDSREVWRIVERLSREHQLRPRCNTDLWVAAVACIVAGVRVFTAACALYLHRDNLHYLIKRLESLVAKWAVIDAEASISRQGGSSSE